MYRDIRRHIIESRRCPRELAGFSLVIRAATHFLIFKSGGKDRVATGISEMDRAARQEEIARMLAGATITDEARAAAERLLRENTAA